MSKNDKDPFIVRVDARGRVLYMQEFEEVPKPVRKVKR